MLAETQLKKKIRSPLRERFGNSLYKKLTTSTVQPFG